MLINHPPFWNSLSPSSAQLTGNKPLLWSCVELGLREFQNGGRLSIYHRTHRRIGEKQAYLQKMMLKSKTQDNRTNGEVIGLLNRRHISSMLTWNNVLWELKIYVSYRSCINRKAFKRFWSPTRAFRQRLQLKLLQERKNYKFLRKNNCFSQYCCILSHTKNMVGFFFEFD